MGTGKGVSVCGATEGHVQDFLDVSGAGCLHQRILYLAQTFTLCQGPVRCQADPAHHGDSP